MRSRYCERPPRDEYLLTDAGRELTDALRQARSAEADRVFTGLDEADRAELERLLRLLLARTED